MAGSSLVRFRTQCRENANSCKGKGLHVSDFQRRRGITVQLRLEWNAELALGFGQGVRYRPRFQLGRSTESCIYFQGAIAKSHVWLQVQADVEAVALLCDSASREKIARVAVSFAMME